MFTEELRNQIKNGDIHAPETRVYLVGNDGSTAVFEDSDYLSSISLENSITTNSGSPFGGLGFAKMTIELATFDGVIDLNFDERQEYTVHFEMYFSEENRYISDRLEVQSVESSEKRDKITITAYDSVSKLDVPYEEVIEEYPVTGKKWLQAFSDSYDINIIDYGMPLGNEEIEQPNVDNMTARQVLQKYLEFNLAAGISKNNTIQCFPVISPDKVAAIDTFTEDSVNEYTTQKNNLGNYGINTLTLALSEDVESENTYTFDQELLEKEGAEIEFRIAGNPFLATPESRGKHLEKLFEQVKGFNYVAYEMNTRALYLSLLDVITQDGIDSLRNENYNIPIYSYSMVYDGAIKVQVAAHPMENAETEDKWNAHSPRKQTEIRTNKIEGRITALVKEAETTNETIKENSAQIEINKQQIKQEIKSREESIKEVQKEIENIELTPGPQGPAGSQGASVWTAYANEIDRVAAVGENMIEMPIEEWEVGENSVMFDAGIGSLDQYYVPVGRIYNLGVNPMEFTMLNLKVVIPPKESVDVSNYYVIGDGKTSLVYKIESPQLQYEIEDPGLHLGRKFDFEGVTLVPSNRKFIGTYVGLKRPDSIKDYVWSAFRGADGYDGVDGLDGLAGSDGASVWFLYADEINPFEGVDEEDTSKRYHGVAVGIERPVDYNEYTWSISQNEVYRTVIENSAVIEANTEAILLEKESREEAFGELYDTVDQHSASIRILDDEIQQNISGRLENMEGIQEYYNKRMDSLESSSQTFESKITDIEGNIATYQTYFTYDKDGMTIGGDEWRTKLKMDGENVTFISNNSSVEAQFGANGMYTNKWQTDLHTIEKFEEGIIRLTIWRDRQGGAS